MVVAYYQVLLAIAIVLTMLYFLSWHKHFDVHVTLIFSMIPIAILGNVLTARSSTLEEAILANKITYFGGTYLLLMITLSILNLCDVCREHVRVLRCADGRREDLVLPLLRICEGGRRRTAGQQGVRAASHGVCAAGHAVFCDRPHGACVQLPA